MSKGTKIAVKKSKAKRDGTVSSTRKNAVFKTVASPVDQVLNLQRVAGNQAVQRLFKSNVIQAKLKIGKPNDKYEQEADRVADIVMRMPEPKESRVTSHKSLDKKDDENVQPKLIAERITPLVQRQAEPEEEEEKELIQPKGDSSSTAEMNPGVESNINPLRGGGQTLPESTRSYFEKRFGYDFSGVRVHTEDKASDATKAVNARAFTVSNNIVFNRGNYSPETSSGKRLLAHELTHVVQQTKRGLSPVSNSITRTSVIKNSGLNSRLQIQRSPRRIKRFTIGKANRQFKMMLRELKLPHNVNIRNIKKYNIKIATNNYRYDWRLVWRKYWSRIPFGLEHKPACTMLANALNDIYKKYKKAERILNRTKRRSASVPATAEEFEKEALLRRYGFNIYVDKAKMKYTISLSHYRVPKGSHGGVIFKDITRQEYVYKALDQCLRWIRQKGQTLAPKVSPISKVPRKRIELKILKYDGSSVNANVQTNIANLRYNQCNITVTSTISNIGYNHTISDLGGDRNLYFPRSGGGSEVRAVKKRARAAKPNQVPVALVKDIKVGPLEGFAGYTKYGVCAVSNRSKQAHTTAHEVGHFFGLWHVGDRNRLMYENANKTQFSDTLIKSECNKIRSKI